MQIITFLSTFSFLTRALGAPVNKTLSRKGAQKKKLTKWNWYNFSFITIKDIIFLPSFNLNTSGDPMMDKT